MSKSSLMAAGAMLALSIQAAAAPGAAAESEAQPGSPPWASVPPQSLSRAISSIERQTGGHVLEIRYRAGRTGDPRYDAIVAEGSAMAKITIGLHPEDDAVTVDERDLPTWMTGWELRTDQKSLKRAKFPLAQAVAEADQMTGGVAIDAGIASPLDGASDILAYNIEVVRDGAPTRLAIDAQNGARIANPDSLLGPWTPEREMRRALNGAG